MLRENLKIPLGWRMDLGSGNSGGCLETPQEAAGVSRGEMAVALGLMVAAGVERNHIH